mmetsp:Transcript_9302/g.17582  ORF Transcript_9302/g.17582 Transcript_9302/m.17582 type:complete len:92 (+) Transcript_9302:1835-2110(+)
MRISCSGSGNSFGERHLRSILCGYATNKKKKVSAPIVCITPASTIHPRPKASGLVVDMRSIIPAQIVVAKMLNVIKLSKVALLNTSIFKTG